MKYKVIFSKRKTLELRVSDGEVIVRAPLRTLKKFVSDFVEKHRSWIEKSLEEQKKKADLISGLTEKDIRRIKKEARIYLTEKTKQFSEIMNIKYGRITITSAMKRFGSCNSKGNICYSYRLMLYPETAREYVVVHELAHILEMNHSPRFYKIIEAVLPDYKERKRLLK